MLPRKSNAATEALKFLISEASFSPSRAVHLVKYGADPNILNSEGKSLLHLFVTQKNEHAQIEKYIYEFICALVKKYNANINIQDSKGCTPLQYLISDNFSAADAIHLVRLGANPLVKNARGISLLNKFIKKEASTQLLDELIEHIDKWQQNSNDLEAKEPDKQKHQTLTETNSSTPQADVNKAVTSLSQFMTFARKPSNESKTAETPKNLPEKTFGI